ncbi:WD40-repeat-containing domain protein [Chytridium lagenaria]|nr:WD40-repeat-containing domain protein [Chytridium lagenaria]
MVAETHTIRGDTLTAERLENFKISKVFADHSKRINSIDFDGTGDHCLSVGDDETMHIYDCLNGVLKKTSYSKKYGCTLGRFTHKSNNILHASTKEDHAIRYLSFHDNKYLRYFKGHTEKVTALEMAPHDDQFLSASRDGTVKHWDLRGGNAVGSINIQQGSRSCIAFDPSGAVFAVGNTALGEIRLFDLKMPTLGPFIAFQTGQLAFEWTSFKFSNCGKYLLAVANTGAHMVLDAVNCDKVVSTLHFGDSEKAVELDATFTPDGNFVVAGYEKGDILMWEAHSGRALKSLEGHREPPHLVLVNPRHMMLATADTAFWTQPVL